MDWELLVAAVVIALICAWVVNSVTGLLSGHRAGSLWSAWWEIFSKLGSRGTSHAEPMPELLQPRKFFVGDKVRMVRVPSNADHAVSPERQKLLEKCAGRVFRVEGIDAFGALELHVQDDGTPASDTSYRVVFISPDCVGIPHKEIAEGN